MIKRKTLKQKAKNIVKRYLVSPSIYLMYKFDKFKETAKHKLITKRLKNLEVPKSYNELKKQIVYSVNKHIQEHYFTHGNSIHHVEFVGSAWNDIFEKFIDHEYMVEKKSKMFWDRRVIEKYEKPNFIRSLAAKVSMDTNKIQEPFIKIYSTKHQSVIGKVTKINIDIDRLVLTFVRTAEA